MWIDLGLLMVCWAQCFISLKGMGVCLCTCQMSLLGYKRPLTFKPTHLDTGLLLCVVSRIRASLQQDLIFSPHRPIHSQYYVDCATASPDNLFINKLYLTSADTLGRALQALLLPLFLWCISLSFGNRSRVSNGPKLSVPHCIGYNMRLYDA